MAYETKKQKPHFIAEPYGLPKELDEKDKFKEEKNEYDKQANDFLKDTNTKFKIKYLKHDKYFPDDEESRDIYKFTLIKDGKTYSGTFGQSINGSKEGKIPRPYDVLSSLGSDLGDENDSFEEFCDEYGYDNDSMKAHKIYKAVQKERHGINKLYSEEEKDKLREIQ